MKQLLGRDHLPLRRSFAKRSAGLWLNAQPPPSRETHNHKREREKELYLCNRGWRRWARGRVGRRPRLWRIRCCSGSRRSATGRYAPSGGRQSQRPSRQTRPSRACPAATFPKPKTGYFSIRFRVGTKQSISHDPWRRSKAPISYINRQLTFNRAFLRSWPL